MKAPFQDHNGDPLIWWRDHASAFHLLSTPARKYFSPPPSTVSSERLFSVSGNVLTESRNRLQPGTAERLILLHENLLDLDFKY